MNARDELADVFTGHPVGFGGFPKKLMRGHAQEIAEAILAAGYRKPRTVTTTEELDAMPAGSIVLDMDPDALLKTHTGSWRSLLDPDGHFGSKDISLPATVLYEPEPQP